MAEAKGRNRAALDHLVVGATTLEEGVDWAEAWLGTPKGGGGKHPTMGTHNALWRLGEDAYLEVIAIDPDAPAPDRPRWFGLDREEIQEQLALRPRLLAWVIRPSRPIAEAAKRSKVPLGPVERHERGKLHWQITVPEDGQPPMDGLVPALIEWPEGVDPPPARLPETELNLVDLVLRGGRSGLLGELVSVGASHLARLEYADMPSIAATLTTPGGEVVID